jgi:bacteriocin biosynthesis cyclodehydratase domain-containing protein
MATDPSPGFEDGTRLAVPAHFQLIGGAENEWFFWSVTRSTRVRAPQGVGNSAALLSRLLAGCTVGEALAQAGEQDRDAGRHFLVALAQRGFLTTLAADEPAPAACTEQDRFFADFAAWQAPGFLGAPREGLPESGSSFQDRLKAARVLVVGLGRVGSRLVQGLSQVGVGMLWGADQQSVIASDLHDSPYRAEDAGAVRESALAGRVGGGNLPPCYVPLGHDPCQPDSGGFPSGLSLLVLCEDVHDPGRCAAVNRACLRDSVPWTSFRFLGSSYEIGPSVIPHETPCFHCMELRKASNLGHDQMFLHVQRSLADQRCGPGGLNITIGYEALALEVVKLLTGFSRPLTQGNLFTFDLLSLEAKVHPILRVPRCPECSRGAASRAPVRIWRTLDRPEDVPDARA